MEGSKIKRRDFLAGAGALALSLPFVPRASIAQPFGPGIAPAGTPIHRIGIYPAIGICRVGGSDKWFHAPEVPGLPPMPEDGSFKDGTEQIKKQAQRFRLYAYAEDGRVIKEVTSDDADIEWNVRVANTKGAWYGFNNPLDNGPLAPGLPGQKRNQYFVSAKDREDYLVIDSGPTSINGDSVEPRHMGGNFWLDNPVGLGRLQTDDDGRLLVIPPDGKSDSPNNRPITSFADNDGWHDDWCDGPVQATIKMKDESFSGQADPSWVACVGPNFAPEIAPISTMYDVIFDMNVKLGWQEAPEIPSFTQHIYPTFQRLGLMQWLTDAANLREGWMKTFYDFSDPKLIDKLSRTGSSSEALRTSVFEQIRPPFDPAKDKESDYFIDQQLKVPYMLGDGINYDGSPYQWFQMAHLQYKFLEQWKEGNFIDDWNPKDQGPQSLDDIPLDLQPFALTQAAMEP